MYCVVVLARRDCVGLLMVAVQSRSRKASTNSITASDMVGEEYTVHSSIHSFVTAFCIRESSINRCYRSA